MPTTPTPALPEPALTTAQFAQAMQVTEYTVREWIKAGKIRGIKMGEKKSYRYRIPRSELERLGAA